MDAQVDVDAAQVDDDASDYEEPPADGAMMRKDFTALVIVEGIETGDGRIYDNISWRNPPLPLMALDTTTEMHLAARMVGNFHLFYKEGPNVFGEGHFVTSTDPQVVALQELIRSGELRGISADMDLVEGEIIIDTKMQDMELAEPDEDGMVAVKLESPKFHATSARLIGATVVPFPAFAETTIQVVAASGGRQRVVTGHVTDLHDAITAATYADLDFAAPRGAREEADRGLKWREEYGRGGTEVGVARARDIRRGANLSPDTIRRMASFFARHEVDKKGQGFSPGEDGFPSAGRIAWALWGGDPGQRWANKVAGQMQSRDESGSVRSIVAAVVAPVHPPKEWFVNPKLNRGTPFSVTDDGRVFGHLALWNSCHIGFPDSCVTPPKTATNYAHFLSGEIVCDGGSRVAVGQVTVDSGHAPLSSGAQLARQHYDDTGWAAADISVGEDAFGIWMAGALRPGLDATAIRKVMAADVSGDWRRAGTNLELVAIACVNVGGFPKIRLREESVGLVASMVASIPVCDSVNPDDSDRKIADRIARSIGRGKASRTVDLFNRVHRPAQLVASLDPSEGKVGDFVRWNSSGGPAQGKITRVLKNGSLKVPGTDFEIEATEENPAALIRIYRPSGDGWEATPTQVGHKFSTLKKIDPLPAPTKEAALSAKGKASLVTELVNRVRGVN